MNIGDRIGDYEIVATLGSGGMGQVYKVRNTVTQRIEAMKVLLPNLEADPALADRFLREIKLQAGFDHPNIATLHTAMRVDNQLLMLMEFIDGTTLAKLIQNGPLPPGEAAAYTAQALDALAYAHAQGVVHRDIKPANLMITNAGVVKLMDFGIARLHDDTRLTSTGGTVGSLSYMSPEQIRGAEPDPRSDIYSLGITLYEMVTGKRPFAATSDYQIMSAHLQEVPAAPNSIVPGIPEDLNEIILMAIAKQPEGRFQSAVAFRGALVSVFSGIAPPLAVPMSMPAAAAAAVLPIADPLSRTQAPTVTATALKPLPVPPLLPAPPPPPSAAARPPAIPAPVPQPAQYQPQMAQFPPQVSASITPSGRRGLYMAIGSIVTVAVLIAAVIEGPKLIHGGSSGAATTTPPPNNSVSTLAVPAPDATPPAAEAPAAAPDAAKSPDAATPAPATTPLAQTAQSGSQAGAQTGSPTTAQATAQTAAQTGSPAAVAPRLNAAAQQRPPQVPQLGSQRTSQQAAAQAAPEAAPEPWHRLPADAGQSPQNNPPPQAAPPPPAQNPEAAQLRGQLNELAIRANGARSGLQSFQQQQSSQGLGLRADIREAQTRLDFQMQESMNAMKAGDFETARRSMRYAQNAVETIEKFLGR